MCILKIFQNFSAAVIRHCLYFDPPYFRTFLIFFCNGNLPHLVNKLNNESSHHLVGSLKREINQPTFFLTVIPLIMLKLPQLLSKNRRQTQVLNSTIFLLPGKSPFPGIKTMEVRQRQKDIYQMKSNRANKKLAKKILASMIYLFLC